jgi:hypothetical protein
MCPVHGCYVTVRERERERERCCDGGMEGTVTMEGTRRLVEEEVQGWKSVCGWCSIAV